MKHKSKIHLSVKHLWFHMNQFALLILMTCFSFFLSNCNKCDDVKTTTLDRFGGGYHGLMPFEGKEKLFFLYNSIDTLIYEGLGKQIYYEEVERPDHDCSFPYRLLNHKVGFRSNKATPFLLFHYYINNGSTGLLDHFIISYGDLQIGPIRVNALSASSSGKFIDLYVLGKLYKNVLPLYKGLDTIYLCGPDPIKQVVRIRYRNDVYEVLP